MSDILMMIGAGLMQYSAIQVAQKAGYKVVAVDGSCKAVGKAVADFFIHADISRCDEVVRQAEHFHKTRPVGGVITVGTDFSLTVARVAEAFGLAGISPDSALAATHKGVMRKRFKEHGVPCPDFDIAEDLKSAEKIVERLGCPCVIKPVDNMGARGVRLIRSQHQLRESFQSAMESSHSNNVILEQFMEGPELSVDTLVYDGQVHLLTMADRIISGEPYFIERGHTIPSLLPEKVQEEVLQVMIQGIRALGINQGASKADMKVTPDGPKIGEMTARLSGGFHSQYTDPLATGMNSIKAAIDIAMGKPLNKEDIIPQFFRGACERSLYPLPGRVVRISGVEEAEKMPGIRKIFIQISKGDIVPRIVSNMGKAGHVIAYGDTREKAIENCERAMKKIQIETVAA